MPFQDVAPRTLPQAVTVIAMLLLLAHTQLPLPSNANTTDIAVGTGNTPGSTFVDPPGFAEPLPGSNASASGASKQRTAQANKQQQQQQQTARKVEPKTVSGMVSSAMQGLPDQLKQLAETPLFKALLERATTGVYAEAFDGLNKIIAKQVARATQNMAAPMANFNKAASNFTNQVAAGAGNVAMKGAVMAIEAAEPVLAASAAVNKAGGVVAKTSKAVGEKLAADSELKLQAAVSDLPPGKDKQVVQQALRQAQTGRRMSHL